MSLIYDVVTCVGKKNIDIAIKSIGSLLLFSDARKIFVISSAQILEQIAKKIGKDSRIYLLNEDQLIDGIDIESMQENFKRRIGSGTRAGWYFQQFLKMSVCSHPEIADYYLIWDSDTILLKSIAFFDDKKRVLINPKTEYRKPYFHLIERILGIERQVNFSFISEHLMVKKEYMKLLIDILLTNTPPNTSWVEYILNSIDDKDLGGSGFSEYETYGNFVALKFRDSFLCRSVNSTRHGTKFVGPLPDKYAIFMLMRFGYTFATFESWQEPSRLRVWIGKSIARAMYILCHLTRCYSGQIEAATQIDR
ncbi:MAG: hypothetical protein KME23_19820 [Goleter apudmare HA4340-LM2]|jgi:hypothetical protein|nr:hypothetical protein [Goleter apudmare HA4340-LM2]